MRFLVFLIIFAACASSGKKNNLGDKSDPVKSGEEIKVKLNETFELKEEATLSTGYSWNLADSAYRQNLSLDTTYTIGNPSGKEGAPETQVFRFRGIAKGLTSIHLIYIQPFRKGEKPVKEKTWAVTVE